jgi:hypothetical protein
MAVSAYGVRVGIRVNDPRYLGEMVRRLPVGWRPLASPVVVNIYSLLVGGGAARAGVRRYNLLYAGATRAARSHDLDLVLGEFARDVQLYVAILARRRVFVHAGVVAWNGRAILMPGRSFSGKSTLTAELVRAGATYYSDEYAVLDAQGRVHPYPRPLALRAAGANEQQDVRAEELGGQVGARPLPVGLVVVSSYREGARWRPRRLSAGQGALEVLANTVPARFRPAESLASVQRAVAGATILKGGRGEAREAAASILQALS